MCLLEMQLSEANVEEIYNKVYKKYEKNHLNRFRHIVGVCNMAQKLALIYGVDPIKAKIAALLHDYYKYEDVLEMDLYLDDEIERMECKKYPFLYHAYCSAKAARVEFKIEDVDIINAIHNHVFGRENMGMLEKIVMISDYTEENRKYEDCIKCREILFSEGIDKAIYYSTLKTIEHVKKMGGDIHPTQEKILKEYEEK